MEKLTEGMKVRYLPQPEWGVGQLISLEDGGARAQVLFPGRPGGPILVSTKQGALRPHQLAKGDSVQTAQGRAAVIHGEVPGARGLRRYVLRFEDGTRSEWPESEVRAATPKPDALTMLREYRAGDANNFLLRRQALLLDDERRCDALGALFASRVMVKPHQVGVVQRVLASPRPRFILADEVGLGKTIEAGMIYSALRLSGLARRVLVVAPSHLTLQWLAELYHKFNRLFTLLDSDRYASSLLQEPTLSPWARFHTVIASLEMLSRTEEHREQAASPEAFWDLVIFDEAHHLKSEVAFQAAQAIAGNAWGLLLLTATPMQLDPSEYHQLLTLIDPRNAPTLAQFEARLQRQEELSNVVRGLIGGSPVRQTAEQLAKRFPEDEELNTLSSRETLLAHLSETYSLSESLIRNRRAVVGGFSERRLLRHTFEVPAEERKMREMALGRVASAGRIRGAALATLVRRLESSPAAFRAAMQGSKELSPLAAELKLPARDAKLTAFLGVVREVWTAEPRAKVLVFTEAKETLEWLQQQLLADRIEALAYHGDLPLVERDRQVARFRDPEGPLVLISTEVGGEGRNFQFAHHLINYDLPWSPAMMEQRIGRLDRIGQMHPVQIHVFDPQGTLSSDVLSVLADAVGVFGETVGGLDALLEEVEPRLTELALLSSEERADYARSLRRRVEETRASIRRAYDPLLDLRSFDRDAVERLLARARDRLGLEDEDEETSLEDGLWAAARDLDERLEEAVTDLARKVGIGVDAEEHVEAFQVALDLGRELTVEALPGISLAEDKVVLGTFWRDTAVEREEIDYFATGHPIVEALFAFLRDGPFGRSGLRAIQERGLKKARGLEFLFHLQAPEPEDTSPGARVPSRQLSRFVKSWLVQVPVREDGGSPRVDLALFAALRIDGRSLRGDEARAAFPGLPAFVDGALAAATAAAQLQATETARGARAAIQAERVAALRRLALSLRHQGAARKEVAAQQKALERYYADLLAALEGLTLTLDSVCGFVING
jgi:ATP-dependent helicase HepA